MPARPRFYAVLAVMILLGGLLPPVALAEACRPPQVQTEATVVEIQEFLRNQGRKVLTFVGYSGAEYEDPSAMLERGREVLDGYDPGTTLVNIGATRAGIGALYPLAKERGFATMGVVSVLARDQGAALSPCVDYVFYVRDETWGGLLPGSQELSSTSNAVVSVSDAVVGIGGGDVARDELMAARAAGKDVNFVPADMNHRLAIEKARKKGLAEPTDFRGAADAALQ